MMGRVLKRDPERIAIETPRVVVKRHTINNTTKSSQSMTPYPPANGAHRGKAGIRNTMYSNVPLHENSGDMLQEEVAKEKNLLSKLVQVGSVFFCESLLMCLLRRNIESYRKLLRLIVRVWTHSRAIATLRLHRRRKDKAIQWP